MFDTTGYTQTGRGLQYLDQQTGGGEFSVPGTEVVVHYTGYLEDGTVFDSSVQRKQPFTFTLGAGQVIEGWDRGIAGMQVGGKRILVIPPAMAYGNQVVGPIPPNSTLKFEVELLEVH